MIENKGLKIKYFFRVVGGFLFFYFIFYYIFYIYLRELNTPPAHNHVKIRERVKTKKSFKFFLFNELREKYPSPTYTGESRVAGSTLTSLNVKGYVKITLWIFV